MTNIYKAVLLPEDRETFFRLFIPLLDFANRTFGVSEELDKQLHMGCPNLAELKNVADVIWENTDIINEYISVLKKENKLFGEDVDLLKSWLQPVSGQFILERHLSKGSVFLDANTSDVYLVKGLTNPWSEVLKGLSPPILLNATLLPFRDCIITDGLVTTKNVFFGPGARSDFKECYLNAKQAGKIITSLTIEK